MILYIDTSSSYLYTGLVEDGKLKKEIKKDYGHQLSQMALPDIVSMFDELHLKPNQIDKIIVVNGPGSFTGIRIGITIAKVYAWSLKIPITTVTSLEAMGMSSINDIVRVVLIDARRNYCYAAIFDEKDNLILEPCYLTYEELNKKLENIKEYKVITNDVDKIKVRYDKIENYIPDILRIVEKYKNKENINPHMVNPEYLKLTEAEESKIS